MRRVHSDGCQYLHVPAAPVSKGADVACLPNSNGRKPEQAPLSTLPQYLRTNCRLRENAARQGKKSKSCDGVHAISAPKWLHHFLSTFSRRAERVKMETLDPFGTGDGKVRISRCCFSFHATLIGPRRVFQTSMKMWPSATRDSVYRK